MTQTEMTSISPDSDKVLSDLFHELSEGAKLLATIPLDQLISMSHQCRSLVIDVSEEWVRLSCEAKQISSTDPIAAEEILSGPVGTVRYLNLIEQSLSEILQHDVPKLPGKIKQSPSGRLHAPILPVPFLYDGFLFQGLSAHVRFQAETTQEQIFSPDVEKMRSPQNQAPSIGVVLGAGNVSSIPIVDALCQIFHKRRAVLLKLNPVNAYLETCFNKAFQPLIQAGFLKIVSGDAQMGQEALKSPDINAVHVTGSSQSYQNIYRSLEHRLGQDPGFEITSELGNVTPWIVVPGKYSRKQLRAQVDQVAASIVTNASFNCITTKMIVTHKGWQQRDEFLNLLEQQLQNIPQRYPYYPGAMDRFKRYAGQDPPGESSLPWTLIRETSPDSHPELFQEESFVCVTAETSLDADSDIDFLHAAVSFVNEQVEGTLAVTLTVPEKFESQYRLEIDEAVNRLSYGTVCFNLFPGVAFGLMAPPWGGACDSTVQNPQSGYGNVHNTFFLDNFDKTTLQGKLTLFPKPVWVPGHKTADKAAWKLLRFYEKPSLLRLPALSYQALRG